MRQKIEIGKTYKTRSGKPVRILATDVKGTGETVAAAVLERNGEEVIRTYFSDGSYYKASIDDYDLIEVKPTITRFVNFYKNGAAYAYDSREQADTYGVRNYHGFPRIACKQITVTEGEGLEESDGGC